MFAHLCCGQQKVDIQDEIPLCILFAYGMVVGTKIGEQVNDNLELQKKEFDSIEQTE